jgi:hypothetical protein
MDKILSFLLSHCSFLYKRYHLTFTDSMVSDSFGGDGYLVLESRNLRLRITCDRGQLFLDFQPKPEHRRRSWFSLDIVRKFLTSEEEYYSLLDSENATFLKSNYERIEEVFLPSNVEGSIRELRKLERMRAKHLFG